MGIYIENRPIGCLYCGYSPIFGAENSISVGKEIIEECRWVCPRCGRLVRVDERKIPTKQNEIEKKNNE